MRTETEIRMAGVQALLAALGPLETERFLAAVSRDRFDYTEWRRHGLPDPPLQVLAAEANALAQALNRDRPSHEPS
ncbi:MAG: hypothetical protein K9L32_04570 [Chromatiaceae bacterium]|nr:hypothetical protein [Chromatiaceae bacterium]MCF8003473.1 hypothetical protein [Chromatiaceae bacterium]